jgi:O-antigen ligase
MLSNLSTTHPIAGPARISSTRFPWAVFIFLLAVFAFSSWDFTPSHNGYDAANADELSETAQTGSIGRQVALTCLGLYALYTARSPRSRKIHSNGLIGVALLAYIAWACASLIWTVDVDLTGKAAARLLLMFFGAVAIARKLTIQQIAKITLGISLVTLLVGVCDELTLGTFDPGSPEWRLSGMMHPVSQGWNCGLLCLSALYLSKVPPLSHRHIYRIAMAIGLVSLALTKSRMALASTIVCMAIVYIRDLNPLQRVASVTASGVVACIAALAMADNAKHYVAFGRESATETSFGTLTGRIPLWEECLRYASKRPLCGYGYNSFLSPSNLLNMSGASGWMSSPHSGYVGALFELGAIGLLLLIATLLLATGLSLSTVSRDREQLFVGCILVWITLNLILESFLITSSFFATFLTFTLLARLGLTRPCADCDSFSTAIRLTGRQKTEHHACDLS